MARDHHQPQVEEEYIDMDINSPTTLKCYNYLPCNSSPPHSIEFEFQMSSKTLEPNQTASSPADELFYKGNLLPLHLPPRLQMVEKLLRLPEKREKPTITTTTSSTPFESCNISPATSCYVSGELNPEEYEYEYEYNFFDLESHTNNKKKLSWSKKLNLIRKLKASKNYLKSLFNKSSGSLNEKKNAEEQCGHRRSFSDVIKRRCSNKSYPNSNSSSSCNSSNSSSFSSVNSNSGVLKRSSSVNSENECSVQGAIAYCKKSQERKSASDVEFCLASEARTGVECEKQEKTELLSV